MQKVILSLDIGGTKINGALVDATSLRILYRAEKISSKPHQTKLLPAITTTIDALLAHARSKHWTVVGCGAVVAGQVQWPSGVVRWSPNIKLKRRRFPLRQWLSTHCHVPTVVDNDVHGFLLGECASGSARAYPLVVAITLGTGIGGAIATNGQLIRGIENKAGEFGHTTIFPPNGLPKRCADGLPGHFEHYGSGQAIRQWYRTLDPKKQHLSTFEIEERWYRHDPIAIAAVNNVRSAIAQGLANIMVGLNPNAIMLGGGLIRMKPLVRGLAREINKFLPFPVKSKIILSRLGDDAQLIGAAVLLKSTNRSE